MAEPPTRTNPRKPRPERAGFGLLTGFRARANPAQGRRVWFEIAREAEARLVEAERDLRVTEGDLRVSKERERHFKDEVARYREALERIARDAPYAQVADIASEALDAGVDVPKGPE